MAQHRILLIDDEKSVLTSLERLFRGEDYEILTAQSGEEALEALTRGNISLIISDQRMPGMQGVALLAHARKAVPDTIRILLTGYTDMKAAIEAINDGAIYKYIEKPWNDEQLKITVKRAVEQYDLIWKNKELNAAIKEKNRELERFNLELEKKVQEKTRDLSQKNDQLQESGEKLKKNFIDTTRVLSGLVEMWDENAGGHSKRVAAASKSIATMYDLAESTVFDIEVAALLHDIGKIGLRDEAPTISNLAWGESRNREIREQHAVMGQMCLAEIDGLQPVTEMIRHHHENYDGSGVPDGLKADAIPIGSRIISVVDAFDGLRFCRTAGKTCSEEQARHAMERQCGTMFDPDVLEKFFTLLDSLRKKEPCRKLLRIGAQALQEDMVLARDIVTKNNMLLVARGEKIRQSYLDKIRYYAERGRIEDQFVVYCPDASLRSARSSPSGK